MHESFVEPFPSSLVGVLGFHPYMHLFSFRKLFVTSLIVLLYRNGKRREVGREGKGKMHGL